MKLQRLFTNVAVLVTCGCSDVPFQDPVANKSREAESAVSSSLSIDEEREIMLLVRELTQEPVSTIHVRGNAVNVLISGGVAYEFVRRDGHWVHVSTGSWEK